MIFDAEIRNRKTILQRIVIDKRKWEEKLVSSLKYGNPNCRPFEQKKLAK